MRAFACLTAWELEFPHTDIDIYADLEQLDANHDCDDGVIMLDIEEVEVVREPVPLALARKMTAEEMTEALIAQVSKEIQEKSEYLARLERSLDQLRKMRE
jgi:hypothetical protein